MIHYILRIFLGSMICFLSGCYNKDEHRKTENDNYQVFDSITIPLGDPVVITGIVLNKEVYAHVKEITLEIPDFKGFETKYTTLIGPDGSFKFKIFPIIAREISLKPIADVLIVHPGDSLYIEKDFKDIANAKFSGDAAELNNNVNKFLSGYYLGRYNNGKYNLKPEDYKRYCESYRNEAYTRLTTFRKEHKTTDEFFKWSKTTIEIDYYSALLHYLMYKKLSSQTKVDSPNNYYDFLYDLNQLFDNSVICSNYFKLINNYYNDYLGPLVIKKYKGEVKRDHKRDSLFINEISNSSKNDLINQFVVSHYFNRLLDSHETEMFEENSGFINSKIKEPFLLKTLSDRYKYIKDYNTNPTNLSNSMLGQSDFKNESPGIALNGPMRKDLVNKIIEGNKNKVVYIDFWAAWCAPCFPEMQHSNRLIQKYAGQNIEFVFICLSDSVIAQQKIKELNIGGKHYFCNSDESIFFQNKYGFQVIPHYVLIDRTGTIVDFGTSLRPSNQRTVEKIDKLLNE